MVESNELLTNQADPEALCPGDHSGTGGPALVGAARPADQAAFALDSARRRKGSFGSIQEAVTLHMAPAQVADTLRPL